MRTKHLQKMRKKCRRTKHAVVSAGKRSVRTKHNNNNTTTVTSFPRYQTGDLLQRDPLLPHCKPEQCLIINVLPRLGAPLEVYKVRAVNGAHDGAERLLDERDLWLWDFHKVGVCDVNKITLPGKRGRPSKQDPSFCHNGEHIRLDDCEVVEGEDPRAKGARPKFLKKGSNVLRDVKVRCKTCGRKLHVRWHPGRKEFLAARHRPLKSKTEQPTTTRKSRRTKHHDKKRKTVRRGHKRVR